MSDTPPNKVWAIIPAAGKGHLPKQYATLAGVSVIEHSLRRFDQHAAIDAIIVVTSKDDRHWQTLSLEYSKPVYTVVGGSERCHSVYNALQFLDDYAKPEDWVLVHDAARPCLTADDLQKLFLQLKNDPVGGILAAPVTDTIKRVDHTGCYLGTEDRACLWRALTPQVFRYRVLLAALTHIIKNGDLVTDDAEAVEKSGYVPKIVAGRSDNIKVTTAEDLLLAEQFLKNSVSLE